MKKKTLISENEVKHAAQLANLDLAPQEVSRFRRQLSEIVEYVGQLKWVETKNIEPVTQVTGLENVARKDEPTIQPLSQEEVLSNTSATHNNLFKVKAILESDR